MPALRWHKVNAEPKPDGADSMVFLASYFYQAEAALAKSLLDNYEIPSALFYEGAHLWIRAPFTVPVVLLVREEYADFASAILRGDFELAAERLALMKELPMTDPAQRELRNVSPWELLALAFYYLLPAFCFARMPYAPFVSNGRRMFSASVAIAHFIGWTGIGFSLLLIAAFVFASSARDKN